jgi:YHS domain-containing protein
MKTIKQLLLIVVLAATVSGINAQDIKTVNNIDDSKIALQGYSPVSYLDLGIAQKGLKTYKITYEGLNYYFTDEEQMKKFNANPNKYLPQYGGYCAFGVSVGAKFRVNPHKFIVKNGKYFLFLYDLEVDAQQLWLQGEHDELVTKANKNWEQLKSKY